MLTQSLLIEQFILTCPLCTSILQPNIALPSYTWLSRQLYYYSHILVAAIFFLGINVRRGHSNSSNTLRSRDIQEPSIQRILCHLPHRDSSRIFPCHWEFQWIHISPLHQLDTLHNERRKKSNLASSWKNYAPQHDNTSWLWSHFCLHRETYYGNCHPRSQESCMDSSYCL